LAALDEVAGERGAEPASVALAWLMAKPDGHGPDRQRDLAEQLATLVAAARLRLSPEEVGRLDEASA
jgi:aryl-alcohol dehydrogenase-like predicted oxidoreductase